MGEIKTIIFELTNILKTVDQELLKPLAQSTGRLIATVVGSAIAIFWIVDLIDEAKATSADVVMVIWPMYVVIMLRIVHHVSRKNR